MLTILLMSFSSNFPVDLSYIDFIAILVPSPHASSSSRIGSKALVCRRVIGRLYVIKT